MESTTKFIYETVLETINLLASEGNYVQLKKWLFECNKEIELRESQTTNIFPLQHERDYLVYLTADK